MQSRGYLPKVKSLEEVLGSCKKMEPKLIGFDETPVEVISPDLVEPETLDNQQSLREDQCPKRVPAPERTGPSKPLVKQQIDQLVLNKPVAVPEAAGNFS